MQRTNSCGIVLMKFSRPPWLKQFGIIKASFLHSTKMNKAAEEISTIIKHLAASVKCFW